MKTITGFAFPETPEEANEWEEQVCVEALHSRILVVAKTRIEGAWSAYIFPVAGMDHREEWHAWKADGNKLESAIAKAIFPQWSELPYDF